MDINGLILYVAMLISVLFVGVKLGKLFARADAVRLGQFKFAGKNYKVEEGE
jgi:hypothetical protein